MEKPTTLTEAIRNIDRAQDNIVFANTHISVTARALNIEGRAHRLLADARDALIKAEQLTNAARRELGINPPKELT
jgi:hypothetical protein